MINLDQLRVLLEDENLLSKYITLFKKLGPENLQKIKEAFKIKDFDAMIIAIHSLKSQFAYLGHNEAHEITIYLESIEKQKIYDNDITVSQAIQSLSLMLDQTIHELDQYTTT